MRFESLGSLVYGVLYIVSPSSPWTSFYLPGDPAGTSNRKAVLISSERLWVSAGGISAERTHASPLPFNLG